MTSEMNTSKRMLSIDTLRGFDMMFIMGVSSLIVAICCLFPGGNDCFLARQMTHVGWEGLHHHDTIFPMFLFISGMTFPFSSDRQREQGFGRGKILGRVIRRGLTLFLLGLVYNGLFKLDPSHLRIPSVLATIGFGWMFAAIIYLFVRNFKTRTVIAAGLLIGYWLLLWLLKAPDAPQGAGPFSYEGNLVGFIDRNLMPKHLLTDNFFDPEGTLTLVTATAMAMLGMLTGDFVKIPDSRISGNRKTVYMLCGAIILVVTGLVWSNWFPIIKKIWSSTFVLVTAGWSIGVYALFYWMIEVKGWRKWTFWFQVIGLNSITIYLGQRIISFSGITDFFFSGIKGAVPESLGSVIWWCGFIAISWGFLYFLYKHKVFLKV